MHDSKVYHFDVLKVKENWIKLDPRTKCQEWSEKKKQRRWLCKAIDSVALCRSSTNHNSGVEIIRTKALEGCQKHHMKHENKGQPHGPSW